MHACMQHVFFERAAGESCRGACTRPPRSHHYKPRTLHVINRRRSTADEEMADDGRGATHAWCNCDGKKREVGSRR